MTTSPAHQQHDPDGRPHRQVEEISLVPGHLTIGRECVLGRVSLTPCYEQGQEHNSIIAGTARDRVERLILMESPNTDSRCEPVPPSRRLSPPL
jgi:hypothetical protein